MNGPQCEAIATIALMAAFADGNKADSERDEIRRVAETLDQAILALDSTEVRHLAYELAVGVVDADGLRNDAETRFLGDLSARLGRS